MALSIGDRRLGALLLEHGALDDDALQRAVARHSEVGGRLADTLISTGAVPERRIAQIIERAMSIPLLQPLPEPQPEAVELIPAQVAMQQRMLPLSLSAGRLKMAMVDPLSSQSIELAEDESGMDIEVVQVLRADLMDGLSKAYPQLGIQAVQRGSGDRLGDLLVARGLITSHGLERALAQQQELDRPLGEILLGLGLLSGADLASTLAEQSGLPFVPDLAGILPEPEVLDLMDRADVERLGCLPVQRGPHGLQCLLLDPRLLPEISAVLGSDVDAAIAPSEALKQLIDVSWPTSEDLLASRRLGLTSEELSKVLRTRAGASRTVIEVARELGLGADLEAEAPRVGLEDTLVQSGKLSPEMLARSLASQLGYEYLDPIKNPPDPSVVTLVAEPMARRFVVLPIRRSGNALVVAMKDPRNVFALDDLRLTTGLEIIPAVMVEADIVRQIERFFGNRDMASLSSELAKGRGAAQQEAPDLSSMDDNAVVKVVDSLIREAVLQDVSDIHIEPNDVDLVVRYRIDGSLREHMRLPKAGAQSLLARIKIMGQLDIAERRVPQDGRVRFRKGSIDVDLRLSTLPTVYGEKAVMRLLRKAADIPEVEQLGFSEHNYQRYLEVVDRPNGIFLVTGPTGSGKSFTSFSTLKRIARPEKNTTTIEDPVEYEIPGINQSQVNNAAGMSFARALRAFLRQDPDIIFVGEIRDTETAGIAVEAALTGHLVLATLHTNDAPGAITRLEEMGLENFNISAAVAGVLAQRLVRRVCSDCAAPTNADPEVLRRLGVSEAEMAGATLKRGAGCPRCGGTGYRGRMGIHELMVVDDALRRAINAGRPVAELKDIAIQEGGMQTLRQDGIGKAMQGLTTLEEVLAVTAS